MNIWEKCFYTIAATDKSIHKEEIAQLKEIVKKEWLPRENTFNEFGDDTAYEIEIVFDWLVANKWDFDSVFSDFKIFRKEHQSLFISTVNSLILKTAKAIATTFSGKNKSEHVLISELNAILFSRNLINF